MKVIMKLLSSIGQLLKAQRFTWVALLPASPACSPGDRRDAGQRVCSTQWQACHCSSTEGAVARLPRVQNLGCSCCL